MRVLLALDGSAEADRATALVASRGWPPGTVIEVLSVVPALVRRGFGRATGDEDDSAGVDHDQVVRDAAKLLDKIDVAIGGAVLTGRPASVIVDEATTFRADLVVVGSRGRGSIATMVLGSVSAEVVDHSPCPVLVVRRDEVRTLLVGVDGSEPADAAVDFLAGFRFLADRVVTVASVFPRLGSAIDPLGGVAFGFYDAAPETFARSLDEVHREHEAYASKAATELRDAGYRVETDVREGDAAHALIELARAREDALIVLGTHGRTGLERAVLGSVARNVLLHAPASVLIVRGPVRERIGDRVRAAVAAGVVLAATT